MTFFPKTLKVVFLCSFLSIFLACRAGAENTDKKNEPFSQSVQAIFDNAKNSKYLEFTSLASQSGVVAVRYFSAGAHNTNFVNEFPIKKIPKNLDFSTGVKGGGPLTIPGMLESLKSAGASPNLSNCKLSETTTSNFDFNALASDKSDGSKAARVAEHFHPIFSLDQNAKKHFVQFCLANKGNSQAYYGLISTPEDNGNTLIYGVLFIFEMENNQWRLRGLAEFL